MNPITEAAPSTTRPHRWNISDTSCEGFYAGTPARVWRARCMNEGCNAKTVFPCHPEEFKGVNPPEIPPCQGKQTPVKPSTPQDNRVLNFHGTEPHRAIETPQGSDNMSQTVPEHIVAGDEITTTEEPMPGQRDAKNNMSKGQYYLSHKPEILADIKALGEKAARKEWGIPASTFDYWQHKSPNWPELRDGTVLKYDDAKKPEPKPEPRENQSGVGGAVEMDHTSSGVILTRRELLAMPAAERRPILREQAEKLTASFDLDKNIVQEKKTMSGGNTRIQEREYERIWVEILRSAACNGPIATRSRYGIPEGTWRGWMKKKDDLHTAVKRWKEGSKIETVMVDQAITKPEHNGEESARMISDTKYSLPVTISTLEILIEACEAQAAKYREIVESLKKMNGAVDG